MTHGKISDLAKSAGGHFKLTNLVHKRMRQLNDAGYRPTSSGRLISTVLTEVTEGTVKLVPTAAEAARAFMKRPVEPEESDAKPKARKSAQ